MRLPRCGRSLVGVFERFTDRARRAVVLAQEEARSLDHNYIGTEHLLLGLLREDEGIAARALSAVGITVETVREEIERRIGRGSEVAKGQIPFTPRAKKVLELSLRQALKLGHDYIGTEHVLLGLLEEGEGVAAQILMTRIEGGLERAEAEVLMLLRATSPQAAERAARALRGPIAGIELGSQKDVLVRLEAIEARLSAIERLLRAQGGEEQIS